MKVLIVLLALFQTTAVSAEAEIKIMPCDPGSANLMRQQIAAASTVKLTTSIGDETSMGKEKSAIATGLKKKTEKSLSSKLKSIKSTAFSAMESRIKMMPDPTGPDKDLRENKNAWPENAAIDLRPPQYALPYNDHTCDAARRKFINTFDAKGKTVQVIARTPEKYISLWNSDFAAIDKSSPDLQLIWTSAKEYANACLSSQVPSGMTFHQVAKLVGALGANSHRFCTGTRISKSRILTARHCVMDQDENGPTALLSSDEIQKLWFEFDSSEHVRYAVCGVNAGNVPGEYNYSSDMVVLNIAQPIDDAPSISIKADVPQIGNYFYMPGLNLAEEQDGFPFLPKSTAVSGCRAVAIAGSCVIHGCQALPGMSGAPLFMIDNKGMVNMAIVGIHLGGWETARLEGDCSIDQDYTINKTPNVGLLSTEFKKIKGGDQ